MRRTRKISVFVALLLMLSLLLVACGNPAETPPADGEQSSADTNEPSGGTAETQQPSGDTKTLTTSDYFDPPPAIHGNPWAPPGLGGMSEYVFDRLFEYAPYPKPEFIPMLGESFEEDGNKTIIHLKQGVKWSDGTAFTSKDVLSTYYLGFMAGWPMWKYVDTIEALDDYTVVINWRKAGPVLSIMAFSNHMMGPYHIYGKWADQLAPLTAKRDAQGNVDQTTNDAISKIREDLYKFKPAVIEVVGTGPYKVSNVTASEAILTKRSDSWCTNNVKIDNVKIQRYVSIEAYLSNVMAGVYDIEPHGSTPDVFKQIQQNNPNMKVLWGIDLGQPSMQFNVSKYPVDDPKIRKAILYVIDQDTLLSIIAEMGMKEEDTYATGLVPTIRDTWLSKDFLSTLENYEYNLSKAESLLKESGWDKGPDGLWRDSKGQLVQLEVACMSAWPLFFLYADGVVNQLNQFGLKTEFKAMELSAYWDYLDNGQAMISFNFRPGAPAYGFPWETYRNIYVDGAAHLGLKNPKVAGIPKINIKLSSGETVDPIALVDELFYTMNKDKQTEIVQKLAQATNEVAPIMPFGEKAAPWKIYNTKLVYPDDPTAPEWYGGASMRPVAKMIKLGKMYYK